MQKYKQVKHLKNILLISGSDRNCGKTTLACHFIAQLAKSGRVIGLKITPHFHLTGNGQQLLAEGDGYRIFRETDARSEKDSARMLKAGAGEVYFIQSSDEYLREVYGYLKSLLPENCPVVCESGSLASVYRPGLHLLVEGRQVDGLKSSYLKNLEKADVVINRHDFSPTAVNFQIGFSQQQWVIKQIAHEKIRRSA